MTSNDPEAIITRMEELVAGIEDDEGTQTPYDELDPYSRKQVDAIARQAHQDDSDSADE